jgi:hypothetical protein
MVFQHSAWPQSRPGDINMTTPWKYTGQSTPRGKSRTYTGGCGLRQRPARAPLFTT